MESIENLDGKILNTAFEELKVNIMEKISSEIDNIISETKKKLNYIEILDDTLRSKNAMIGLLKSKIGELNDKIKMINNEIDSLKSTTMFYPSDNTEDNTEIKIPDKAEIKISDSFCSPKFKLGQEVLFLRFITNPENRMVCKNCHGMGYVLDAQSLKRVNGEEFVRKLYVECPWCKGKKYDDLQGDIKNLVEVTWNEWVVRKGIIREIDCSVWEYNKDEGIKKFIDYGIEFNDTVENVIEENVFPINNTNDGTNDENHGEDNGEDIGEYIAKMECNRRNIKEKEKAVKRFRCENECENGRK